MDRVWPYYLDAYLHGDEGRQYWLSYDELLALATISQVNLLVVEEREDAFHYVGDNLEEVGKPEERIVITSIRGGGHRVVESHFERLLSDAEASALNVGAIDLVSQASEKASETTEGEDMQYETSSSSESLSDSSSSTDTAEGSGDEKGDAVAETHASQGALGTGVVEEPSAGPLGDELLVERMENATKDMEDDARPQERADEKPEPGPSASGDPESSSDADKDVDGFSDISDNSDLFHVAAVESLEPRTDEDAEIRICQSIAPHLREYPLMPVDGRDATKDSSFTDMQSGIR